MLYLGDCKLSTSPKAMIVTTKPSDRSESARGCIRTFARSSHHAAVAKARHRGRAVHLQLWVMSDALKLSTTPRAVIVTTKPSDRGESADVCADSLSHHTTPLWLSLGIVEEQAICE